MSEGVLAADIPLTVVDVGASGGLHPRWDRLGVPSRAVLFEPDPSACRALVSRARPEMIVCGTALSDSAGKLSFHVCRKPQVSSVYPPNRQYLDRFPDRDRFDVLETIRIEADTLDNQLKRQSVADVDFIKIDVQGYELAILKGAARALAQTVGLELEVEFASLYQGQPLAGEVDGWVKGKGFELFDLQRTFWKRRKGGGYIQGKGQLVYGNALYFRSPETILASPGLKPEKSLRALCVYLAYGYRDLAEALAEGASGRWPSRAGEFAAVLRAIGRRSGWMVRRDFPGKASLRVRLLKLAELLRPNRPFSVTDRELGGE